MKAHLPIFILLLLLTFVASYSRASTLTVTKIEDTSDGVCDGDCSLREAVAAAAAGDTVVFSTLFNTPQTITLTLGQINITQNLTITGTGPNLVDISANLAGRVFNISGNINVIMSGMKLRDGRVGVDIDDARGGAILFLNTALDGGTLNLTDMEMTNNRAFSDNFGRGAAVYCLGPTMTLTNVNVHDNNFEGGAAIQTDFATVNICDSIVSDNRLGIVADSLNMHNTIVSNNVLGGVGAIDLSMVGSRIVGNTGRGASGGAGPSTIMTVENSTISANTDAGLSSFSTATIRNTLVTDNQYIGSGGGIINQGTMHVIDSAITGNSASQHGGGISTYDGHLFLTNSTVSGNIANGAFSTEGFGGGVYVLVNGANPMLTVTNSTISNNQSKGGGGGVRVDSGGTATIRNSIIAGNTSTDTNEEDVSGSFTSHGISLIGNTTGSSGWIAGDLLNVNPLLGPLADNGGNTLTHALLPGSPAINAGNNLLVVDPQTQTALTSDQRGFLRFYGGTVDIGAYELQPEVSGTITYGNATGAPTPRFVSNVTITGIGSPNVSAISLADGSYTLGGFGTGPYTVTPSKTDGVNGITSFDAGRIAQHVVGIDPFTGNQLIVAEVSGNGIITSFDAAQIARYVAGLNKFGSTGNWIFIPANRTYSSVNSTITGEDFIALLMGEVSGNWVPGSGRQGVIQSKVNFASQECEGPTGRKIITSKAVCSAIAEERASAAKKLRSRLSAMARKKHPAAASALTSANRYPIMARRDNLQSPSAAGRSNRHREIDRLIGESLADYCIRRSVEDMAKAKAKARAEEELRKCLPKEGELPNWAEDWVTNVWQSGKRGISAKHSHLPMLIDPVDPNVMWKWDKRGWLSKSLDGGVKWERLTYTYQRRWRHVSSIAVARENGKTILLAGVMGESFSFDSGIMRSDDGGELWYRVCDGFAALSVTFDPENPQNAIAEIVAPFHDFAVSRVVFSTDGGRHWKTATQNGVIMETDSESAMRALAAGLKKSDNRQR